MQHDWIDFTGETLDGRYTLNNLLMQDGDLGIYETVLEGQPAVVRVLPASAESAEAAERAWETARHLDHPGLVKVFHHGRARLRDADVVYAVSERPDEAVSEVLPERALSRDETEQLMGAVLPVLHHLHHHGIMHGDLRPVSIQAVGDHVKLSSDTLRPIDGDHTLISRELRDFGATVIELLTQERPSSADASMAAGRLDPPFRQIAARTLAADPARQWSIEQVQRALAGQPVPETPAAVPPPPDAPAPVPPPAAPPPVPVDREPLRPAEPPPQRRPAARQYHHQERREEPADNKNKLMAAGGALLLLVILLIIWRTFGTQPAQQPVQSAPPGPAATSPPDIRPPATGPRTAAPPVVATPAPGWAVVAAVYRSHADADRRAAQLRARWRQTPITVYPGPGAGKRYLVLLATGLPSRNEAQRLRSQARSAGLPRDTYVTRLEVE